MEFIDALIITRITGGVSSLGTITVLKTDINWIKRVQQDQKQRIRKLEIPNERTQVQGASTKRAQERTRGEGEHYAKTLQETPIIHTNRKGYFLRKVALSTFLRRKSTF